MSAAPVSAQSFSDPYGNAFDCYWGYDNNYYCYINGYGPVLTNPAVQSPYFTAWGG